MHVDGKNVEIPETVRTGFLGTSFACPCFLDLDDEQRSPLMTAWKIVFRGALLKTLELHLNPRGEATVPKLGTVRMVTVKFNSKPAAHSHRRNDVAHKDGFCDDASDAALR